MDGAWGYVKAVGKRVKKAVCKSVRKLISCGRTSKEEDLPPGFPEVKITYEEEAIPETLETESLPWLGPTEEDKDGEKDLDSDSCPVEAEFCSGPISDSLEGIPDMFEAESLTSFRDDEEAPLGTEGKAKDGEKHLDSDACPSKDEPNPGPSSGGIPEPQGTSAEEPSLGSLLGESLPSFGATEKGKDGEKADKEDSVDSGHLDSDACPRKDEPNPGPRSDSVSEAQGTYDEEGSIWGSDEEEVYLSPVALHDTCQSFPDLSEGTKKLKADYIARNYLSLMLEHFLESPEPACNELMFAVFSSANCNLNTCLDYFMQKANEGSLVEDSEKQRLAKVKAVRGIGAIVRHLGDVRILQDWLPYHFATMANILFSQALRVNKGTDTEFKMYLVPGEAIDILGLLLQRLNLVHQMLKKP